MYACIDGNDYYLCDICRKNTFMDRYLYVFDTPTNYNKKTGHLWPDGDVVDMAVICNDCAKTHRIEIVTIEPES